MLFVILQLYSLTAFTESFEHYYRDGVPRFKTLERTNHEVFLGDKVKLSCFAMSKSPPLVQWYRNGELIDKDTFGNRLREHKKHMTLDIKAVEVSDQGAWTCKVSNQVGFISRNFTVEIIDFCDYFSYYGLPVAGIPMECVCLWLYTNEKSRRDVDYSVATTAACQKYAPRIEKRVRKPRKNYPCLEPPCDEFGMPLQKHSQLLIPGHQHVHATNTQEDLNEGHESENQRKIALEAELSETTTQPLITHSTFRRRSNKEELYYEPPPLEVKPTFKDGDDTSRSLASPAGRTVKLSCKGTGAPEPRVVWHKNGAIITEASPRMTGAEFKIRKGVLELEDAAESDSGKYMCEVFNSLGSIRRTFNVTIVNRMRGPPIIVPNILMNQTVNVNGTAIFNCRVVSDLTPYIFWVRIDRVNGSIHYYNETAGEHMFKYTEMDNIPNADVITREDESTLHLTNVTLDDQGLYACITGNSLGSVMANATLTVNEFLGMVLLTGEPDPEYSTWSILLLLVIVMLLSLMLSLCVAYYVCFRITKKRREMEDRVGLMPKKKRVVVTHKKIPDDKDGWSDPPSTYQIQIIEQVATTSMGRRPRLSSDLTLLSDYEIDPDPEWEIDRNRLKLIDILGEGAFGEVWRAMLQPEKSESLNSDEEIPVAVKKLKASANEKELIDLVSEMETFKIIGQHKNLLRLMGCCTGFGPLYVILELCKHGNLRDFLRLHRPREDKQQLMKKLNGELSDYLEPRKISEKSDNQVLINPLTQRHLVQFAWQVANGMQFMAQRKIIHRDLAARNVLVADNFVLKISDFGLSRDVHYNDYYRKKGNGRLPIKWMALEALDSHVYTIESDVWSFGILLWEIMTLGGTPYPTIAMQQLYACLKEGYRMEAPHNCPQEVYNLMLICWQDKREQRPSFETIYNYLDWMLAQSDEIAHDIEVDTASSDDLDSNAPPPPSNDGSLNRKRRIRPLSAPVFLPSDPQHSICDDEGEVEGDTSLFSEQKSLLESFKGIQNEHLYSNQSKEYSVPSSKLVRQQTDPKTEICHSLEPSNYCEPRSVSDSVAHSVDSAIGSPEWHIQEQSNNQHYSVPFLGEQGAVRVELPYMNVVSHRATPTRFPFPPLGFPTQTNRIISRFSDSLTLEPSPMTFGYEGNTNPAFMPSPSPYNVDHRADLNRRDSTGSHSSSGHGGSSTQSSSEGIGGFCRLEYSKTISSDGSSKSSRIENEHNIHIQDTLV